MKTTKLSKEEESRIFHTLASYIKKTALKDEYGNTQTILNQIKYSENLIDELVELQCIEQIIEKIGEEFHYKLTEIRNETEQIRGMLQETFEKYGKQMDAFGFDLQNKNEWMKAAEISHYACQYHEKGIYIFIVYMVRSLRELEENKKEVREIQQISQNMLKELGVKYRPGESLSDLDKYQQAFKNLDFTLKVDHNVYSLKKSDNKLQKLDEIIIEEAKLAESHIHKLERIVSECCLKDSLWSSVNLKVYPNKPNKKAMTRVKQKMLFKKDSKKELQFANTLQETFDNEEAKYGELLQKILDEKEEIQFRISDMLRGKCVFSTIEDILIAVQNIKNFINQKSNEYNLVEVENRFVLENPIADITLKIQIEGKLVAELQLTLQNNFAMYNFAHKIYEFGRSKIFSKSKTLHNYYIQYKKVVNELIIAELQEHSWFSVDERTKIFHFFGFECDQKNTFSFEKLLAQRIKKEKITIEEQFDIIGRFKKALSLMIMVFQRKIKELDLKNMTKIQQQPVKPVKSMMILQLMKACNPSVNQSNMKVLWDSYQLFEQGQKYSFRNKMYKIQQLSYVDQKEFEKYATNITKEFYGHRSMEVAHFLSQLMKRDEKLGKFDKADKYAQQIKDCLTDTDQGNQSFKNQIIFKQAEFKFLMGNVSKETQKELDELLLIMKKNKNSLYALKAQLLLAEYYHTYENDQKLYKEHWERGQKMAKIEGIPLGKLIDDIRWRINIKQFSKAADKKSREQIFNKKLSALIQEFGAYKQFNAIYLLMQKYLAQFSQTGIDFKFKPNHFTTLLRITEFNEQKWGLLLKMEFRALQEIHLNSCQITDKECEYLRRCKWPNLRGLYLGNNQITDDGLQFLIKGNCPYLTTLELTDNKISNRGCSILTKVSWPKLTYLNLSLNSITDEGCDYLAKGQWPDLVSLFLFQNKIQGESEKVKILEKAFPNAKHIRVQ